LGIVRFSVFSFSCGPFPRIKFPRGSFSRIHISSNTHFLEYTFPRKHDSQWNKFLQCVFGEMCIRGNWLRGNGPRGNGPWENGTQGVDHTGNRTQSKKNSSINIKNSSFPFNVKFSGFYNTSHTKWKCLKAEIDNQKQKVMNKI
jgi:hypothetical protein